MARSHGKILVDVWLDPDFIAMDVAAQWAYFMLLSQPKLTLVGSIDYRPNHWAEFSPALTTAAVDDAVTALEAHRFVCVDRGTEELLVRSMTRHDGLRAGNSKLLKGLWSAWKGIASVGLRKVAVDNMPDSLFGTPETPKAAEEMRRSERMDWAIEQAMDRPIAPPSTIHHPPSAVGRSDRQSSGPVDKPVMLSGSGLVHRFTADQLPRLRVVDGNPNHAAGGESHPAHVSAPLTNGGVS